MIVMCCCLHYNYCCYHATIVHHKQHHLIPLHYKPNLTNLFLNLTATPIIPPHLQQQKQINWGKTTYPITKNLIVDGRKNLLLAGGKKSIKISCPIRLVHALYDEEVKYCRECDVLQSNAVAISLSI